MPVEEIGAFDPQLAFTLLHSSTIITGDGLSEAGMERIQFAKTRFKITASVSQNGSGGKRSQ
jgi:hypothetical protein